MPPYTGMSQRVIIVGGGPVGSRVANSLGDYGHDPVVIEQDADRCEQLQRSRHGLSIHGDARRPEIVDQAAPERADVLAALTGDPELNHALCRRVRARPGAIRTVARGEPPDDAGAGADETVHTAVAGATAVTSAVLGHDQQLFAVPASGFDLVEFGVDPRAPAADRRLSDVALPEGSHVVADTDRMDVAGPGTELQPGRRYLLAVEPGAADTVSNLLRGGR